MRLVSLLRRSEGGQVLILTGLLLPVLLGFTGLAVDIGILMARRTHEQSAADSAAIAAAQKWLALSDKTVAEPEARAYAQRNGYTDGVNNTQVNVTFPSSCGVNGNPTHTDCVKVTIRRTAGTFFIRVLGADSATVSASAVAAVETSPKPYALIVLDPHACPAYDHSGSGTLTLVGGGAIINSDGSVGTGGICPDTAAQQKGGAIVTANSCWTTDSPPVAIPCPLDHLAGTNWSYPAGQASPPPTTVGKPVPDPLSGLQRPVACTNSAGTSPSGCVYKSPDSAGTWNNPKHTTVTGTKTLRPGTYYGGLTVNGGAGDTVTFAPGLYIFAGGEGGSDSKRGFRWRSSGKAIVSGTSSEGVTFYNSNYNAAGSPSDRPCGAFDVTSSGQLSLRAPADLGAPGPLDDNPVTDASDRLNGVEIVTFWQADDCAQAFKYAGGSHSIGGVLYAPSATLNISGGGSIGSVQIIVNKVDYSGNNNVTINYTNYLDITVPYWALVE
jgi:Flp pilus assembly protein TadG